MDKNGKTIDIKMTDIFTREIGEREAEDDS